MWSVWTRCFSITVDCPAWLVRHQDTHEFHTTSKQCLKMHKTFSSLIYFYFHLWHYQQKLNLHCLSSAGIWHDCQKNVAGYYHNINLNMPMYCFVPRMANFQSAEAASGRVHASGGGSGINEYVASLFDPTLTWDDVAWLKRYVIDLPMHTQT